MYMQLIGSLMYLTHTRPDMQFKVSALSQFMAEPRERHWVAGKHILRYLRGTIAYGLKYTSSGGVMLYGYADSNWVGRPVDRKRTSGYCFSLGSTMISWSSRNRDLLLRAQSRLNILRLAMPVQKQCGSKNLFLGYLVKILRLRLYIVIIRDV
jgi:hypothetical protein